MKLMKQTVVVAAAIGGCLLGNAARAEINIDGDLDQRYEARYSPQTAVAVGAGSKATADANVIEGKDVKIGGNARQSYSANYSPQTAVAVGAGAEARVSANRVTSN